jgi:hypothetical protein
MYPFPSVTYTRDNVHFDYLLAPAHPLAMLAVRWSQHDLEASGYPERESKQITLEEDAEAREMAMDESQITSFVRRRNGQKAAYRKAVVNIITSNYSSETSLQRIASSMPSNSQPSS